METLSVIFLIDLFKVRDERWVPLPSMYTTIKGQWLSKENIPANFLPGGAESMNSFENEGFVPDNYEYNIPVINAKDWPELVEWYDSAYNLDYGNRLGSHKYTTIKFVPMPKPMPYIIC